MNRRQFLQCAAVVVANASVVPASWAMNPEQQRFLAGRPSYVDRHPLTFFDSEQRAVVAAIAEQIIPKTDTPGAGDAGVPRFIELMVADWFNEKERRLFMDGLADLRTRSDGSFAEQTAADQLLMLEELERETEDSSWYEIGNVMRVWDDTAPFICQFKELTALGFFLSEVGATQVLRLNSMGAFHGDVPSSPSKPSYASLLPMRQMLG
ncbi:MAG: gluconate 2-dehydrogenase subunit 3 family protein, partial [Myxococcota bacterium]